MYKALNPGMVNLNVHYPEAAALAARYGFGALEWDPLDLIGQYGASGAQDIAAQHGVVLCSFALPVPVQIEHPDYKQALGQLSKAASAARSLGIRRCSTYILSWSDELPFEQNFDAHVRRLRPCAEILREYDISLGLEFLGPQTLYSHKKYEFIHTLEGMLKLCDAIGTDNMGILLDAYHVYAAGMDVADCLGAFKSEAQITVVHINDAPKGADLASLPDTLRYLPGEGGGIDLAGFLKGLKSFGYTGPVVIEPFSEKLRVLNDPDQIMSLLQGSTEGIWPI